MKSIDKNVIILGWVSFFTDLATAMINPILPIFVVGVLDEGVDKLGIIVAIATFISYGLRLLSGYISDRYGIVKPLVVSGYALSALSKPLLGFAHSYKSVAALKGLERLGKALRSAPKDLLLATYSKKRATGKTFGFHKTLDIAGEMMGSLIAFFILWRLGEGENIFRFIFFATILPGLIALVLVIFFVKDVPKKPKVERFHLTRNDKEVIKLLGLYFAFIFFMWGDAFFTMEAKEVGIAVMFIPLLFVLFTATQTLTSYLLGVWIDRFGALKILSFGFLSGIASLFFLWLQKPLFVWIAYAFFGLFMVASLNAIRSYIALKSDNRGSVYGIFYGGVALFGAFGAFVCGQIWERLGMDAALLFALIGTILVMLGGRVWRY